MRQVHSLNDPLRLFSLPGIEHVKRLSIHQAVYVDFSYHSHPISAFAYADAAQQIRRRAIEHHNKLITDSSIGRPESNPSVARGKESPLSRDALQDFGITDHFGRELSFFHGNAFAGIECRLHKALETEIWSYEVDFVRWVEYVMWAEYVVRVQSRVHGDTVRGQGSRVDVETVGPVGKRTFGEC